MSKLSTLLQDLCAYPKLDSQADEEALLVGLRPQLTQIAAHLAKLDGVDFERACLEVYLALKQPASPFSRVDRGAWFTSMPVKLALVEALSATGLPHDKRATAVHILTGAFIHADLLSNLVCATASQPPEATRPIYAALDYEGLQMSEKTPAKPAPTRRKRAV